MKGIFNFWFPSNKPPKVGDVFILDSDVDNPFKEDKVKILITGVKDGYIEYAYNLIGNEFNMYSRNSMTVKELNWIFTKEQS